MSRSLIIIRLWPFHGERIGREHLLRCLITRSFTSEFSWNGFSQSTYCNCNLKAFFNLTAFVYCGVAV
jgi:hypothetical protein